MARLSIQCPSCGFQGKAAEENIGKRARCRQCGKAFTVMPAAAPSSAAAKVQGDVVAPPITVQPPADQSKFDLSLFKFTQPQSPELSPPSPSVDETVSVSEKASSLPGEIRFDEEQIENLTEEVSEPIRFTCARCRRVIEVEESQAGKKLQCGSCGQRLEVPRHDPRNETMMGEFIPPPSGVAPEGCLVPIAGPAPATASVSQTGKTRFACPRCQQHYETHQAANVVVTCLKCAQQFVPAACRLLPTLTPSLPGEVVPKRILLSNGKSSILETLKGLPTGAWWLITAGMIAGILFVAVQIDEARQKRTVRKAHELYSAGKHGEAVWIYKSHFPSFDKKAEVLKRIVEFEIDKGNTEEASQWITHGLNTGLSVKFDNAAAEALGEKIKRERAAQFAKAEAEKEEAARKKEREKEEATRKKEQDRKANEEARAKANEAQTENDRKFGSSSQVREMAIKDVKSKLNFPAEAKIKVLVGPKLRSDGIWDVGGTVVGKNAFGVKSELNWVSELKKVGETKSGDTTISHYETNTVLLEP